ncbi:transposase [Kitasatospora albolonga]
MSSNEVRAAVPDDAARMQTFMDETFRAFRRPEQRRWAQAYLWALIHVSGKKTPRRMALAKPLPSAAAHGLHQFINASPWDWNPVRRRLARLVTASAAPHAWTVTELVIPKRGEHSVGVHRYVDTATGRAVNCQRAVGLFLASGHHSYPVDWRLVLGGAWDSDQERRRRARIPGTEGGRTVTDLIVEYAAEAATRYQLPGLPWVLDLTRYEDAAGVLAGLERLGADVVCEVPADLPVLASQHTSAVTTVGALMELRHARQTHVLLRHSADGHVRAVPVHTYAGTVNLPRPGNGTGSGTGISGGPGNGTGDDAGARPYRILERPGLDVRQPCRYWLTTLTDRRVEEILRLARSHSAALSAVTTLRHRFGVLDFEGRSFPGWHHHMTMASAAYVYQRLSGNACRATPPPDRPDPPDPPPRAPAASVTPAAALADAPN